MTDEASIKIYVSPNGRDSWSGLTDKTDVDKKDGPLASIYAVKEVIGELKRKGKADKPIEVIIHAGIYAFDHTLQFDIEELANQSAPVSFKAAGDGEVVFTGGVVLKDFVYQENGTLKLDVNAAGLKGVKFDQLQCDGKALRPARYPKYSENNPYEEGWLYVEGNPVKIYEDGHGYKDRFVCRDPRLKNWSKIDEVEVFVFPRFNWTNDIIKIKSYDAETGEVILERPAIYEFYPRDRFYFRNVKEELNQPGEWYFDKQQEALFIVPPEGFNPEKNVLTASVVDNIIEASGPVKKDENLFTEKIDWVSGNSKLWNVENSEYIPDLGYLKFDGITFDGCNGAAVVLRNANCCEITGCTVRNTGGVGIIVLGGKKCSLYGNDIYHTGSHGIYISGGLRSPFCGEYVKCHHNVSNNYIHHMGLVYKSVAGIAINGVGIHVNHNYIHDGPRWGILSRGNDHIIEYNHIRHVNTETCDTSAIYLVDRDLTMYGTIIRFNKIHDILGYQCVDGEYKFYDFTFGVYLDDWTSGVSIYGNLIYRTPSGGVFVHGGHDNVVENNIIFGMRDECVFLESCGTEDQYRRLGTHDEGVKNNLFKDNIIASYEKKVNVFRFSNVAGSYEGMNSKKNEFKNNIIWTGGLCPNVKIQYQGETRDDNFTELAAKYPDQGNTVENPLFTDIDHDDFTLSENSPAKLKGFQDLPVKEMGLYFSDKRASWPIHEAKGVREWLNEHKNAILIK